MVTWGARSTIVAGQNLAPGGQYLSGVITNNAESSEVFAAMGAQGIIEILREIDGELLEASLTAKLVQSPNGQWVGAAIVMGVGYSRFRVRVTNLGDAATALDLDYAQAVGDGGSGGGPGGTGDFEQDVNIAIGSTTPTIAANASNGNIAFLLAGLATNETAVLQIEQQSTTNAPWLPLGNPGTFTGNGAHTITFSNFPCLNVRLRLVSSVNPAAVIDQVWGRFS